MPRRKKKKKVGGADIPPLEFVESPLDRSPPVLSPEYSAINPITAKTVAVDDIHDLSWVTPQFGDRALCCGQYPNQMSRRITRLRKKSSNDMTKSCGALATKYRPLSFVTNNRDSITRRNGRYSYIRNEDKTLLNRKNAQLNTIDNGVGESNRSPCGTGSDRLHKRNSFPESFRISTPVINENEDGSDQENSIVAPARPEIITSSHNARFNTSQLKNYEDNYNSNTDNTKLCNDNDNNDGGGGGGEVCNELSVLFSKSNSKTKKKPLLLDCSPSSSRSQSPVPRVLVTDTPECDYDLTWRQKQIKYLFRKRQKR